MKPAVSKWSLTSFFIIHHHVEEHSTAIAWCGSSAYRPVSMCRNARCFPVALHSSHSKGHVCSLPTATCLHPDAAGRGQRPELSSDGRGLGVGLVVASGSSLRFLACIGLECFCGENTFLFASGFCVYHLPRSFKLEQ